MYKSRNTRELIRNSILHSANLFWGKKNQDMIDPMIKLMIESLSSELHLIQNKIGHIDTLLLEKTALRLTPDFYTSIRPAHALLQITPNAPTLNIDRMLAFYMKDIPTSILNKGIDTVTFHPVMEMQLMDVKISHLFHKNKFFEINSFGEKSVMVYSSQSMPENIVWIGLDISEKIQNLKNLFFYFDFPNLDENHDCYELLPYTEWSLGKEKIKLKKGFPELSFNIETFEKPIIQFYEDRYLTIKESFRPKSLLTERLPSELIAAIDEEDVRDLMPRYWIKIEFPSIFSQYALENMVVALNTFPVSNKRLYSIKLKRSSLTGMPLLPANRGEKFLNIESVTDSNNTKYRQQASDADNLAGTFSIETIKPTIYEEPGVLDYIERLVDIILDEKVAFPSVDAEKINDIMKSIVDLQGGASQKMDSNKKNNRSDIAKILIHPYESTNMVDVEYWVTNSTAPNDIPSGQILMPQKSSKLNGQNAFMLSAVCGGKEFYDFRDIMLIHKYILTSRDRVITKDNIIDFCKSELGNKLSHVEVIQTARVGIKPKDGLIRQIDVYLTPSVNHSDYLKQNGILRDLRIRLKHRSPDTYRYKLYLKGV